MARTDTQSIGLFEAFGVELEYMIVSGETLDVLPVCDDLIRAGLAEGGQSRASDETAAVPDEILSPIAAGSTGAGIHWSNELTLHLVELKTGTPARRFTGLAEDFQENVRVINGMLGGLPGGARLLPAAMHPWMNPMREMVLWPHGYNEVFQAFSRIFDCRGHGWANLQSVHLNLPFAGDDEFGRLHAAVRVVLPILPALCASSPVMDGRWSGRRDNRLAVYAVNSARVPQVAGRVIPEDVYTADAYAREILAPLYRAIAPLDPDGVLQDEWLNARGAIARFQRNTIEIRVMDVQECPAADLSICAAVSAVVRLLTEGELSPCDRQRGFETERLRTIFDACVDPAEDAVIADREYLGLLGLPGVASLRAAEAWGAVIDRARPLIAELGGDPYPVEAIIRHGTLATRIERALALKPRPVGPHQSIDQPALHAVYTELADCLSRGRMFRAD